MASIEDPSPAAGSGGSANTGTVQPRCTRARIGGVLLQLAQEVSAPLIEGLVTLRIRQAEIGQMAGVARETVSRVLANWQEAGLISIGRGRNRIPDRVLLQKRLEEEADDLSL